MKKKHHSLHDPTQTHLSTITPTRNSLTFSTQKIPNVQKQTSPLPQVKPIPQKKNASLSIHNQTLLLRNIEALYFCTIRIKSYLTTPAKRSRSRNRIKRVAATWQKPRERKRRVGSGRVEKTKTCENPTPDSENRLALNSMPHKRFKFSIKNSRYS